MLLSPDAKRSGNNKKRKRKKFVPFDVATRIEAINYIQKNFPPYQRGRTYGQKILIEKFKLKPEEYA